MTMATSVPLGSAPVLSTPETHIFEDATPVAEADSIGPLSDEQIALTYEIARTVQEIRAGRCKRIALQFPDHMLTDGPRVYEQLSRALAQSPKSCTRAASTGGYDANAGTATEQEAAERLFILGDTSYGACCIDEVAAEHVDADVVVHYGRSCLSPPSRLPVIYVFTERPLHLDAVLATFQQTYPDKQARVILMADIPYSHHIPALHARLQAEGYPNTYATDIIHNPSSPLPNRTIPPQAETEDALRSYALFHISDPPTALLLTLSSRVASIHIYPTTSTSSNPTASQANAAQSLRRRYALLTSLSTTPIFGILINTLSVKNYMHMLSHVQRQIAEAGKKSYTFVVGKVNAAKVANFSEVGGWVVIGCWESSLIESKEFWRPMITPWELGIALQGDEERVWTGSWEADFQRVLDARTSEATMHGASHGAEQKAAVGSSEDANGDYDSEEESAPPEFDLRTGRYVSHSRPMRSSDASKAQQVVSNDASVPAGSALTMRAKGHLAAVGGVVSPGAEFLRSQRTWQGLGSEDRTEEQSHPIVNTHAAKIEEGRSGIARGYVVGEQGTRH
ncbi:diphthamide biosynthesis protein-like protein [Plenodomus tracheiphilus IPT5]|uniref:2-(3-amino-3-carboxypropyl)histidine synthase subunit 2 n=1 Tax=Plenodomus tracheiphilus IPT5 TaxID=1408161 RepID=A0A6A7AP33_9PLEO|nr:diphthamide biosynthesis protein-like protein [Plenodomus tracheiphilus IPT5]